MLDFIKTDSFFMTLFVLNIILVIGFAILIIKQVNLNNKYNKFIKKLGDGKNIEEDLETFMYRVDKVEKQNGEIIKACELLDKDIRGCIQKVGMVRYNAYENTGSDLSFALALLNDKNDGVVLNGIYSREFSNIYAKTVNNGKTEQTVSKEEAQAIANAMSENKKKNEY